jgi:hypothetical protein
MLVATNKEVDSSNCKDVKIRRGKTRSAIVLIWYNLIELQDILSRLVVAVIRDSKHNLSFNPTNRT